MADNEWTQPDAPPPPLFTGKKERDFVKQVTDEVVERIIGQGIFYYPISTEHTEFHEVYGEAITKTFLPPIRVYALVEWNEFITETGKYGVDKRRAITIHFHKRRLTEDQDLYVREGDFVKYGTLFYEIVSLSEPQQLFGQTDTKVEIVAKCIRAREGKFNAK
jgi:phenylpropionate dioxygenase-like ring-hydroxylating dioxygenase large terminal subunit